MSETIDTDALVVAYIKMRDSRAALKKTYEEQDDAIKAQMDTIEQTLLELCKSTNSNSLGTGHGTVIRGVKSRYWASDWQEMYNFIKEHQAPELLEQRIHQKNFGEFLKNNPGTLPKGMNLTSEYTITVRRKTGAN